MSPTGFQFGLEKALVNSLSLWGPFTKHQIKQREGQAGLIFNEGVRRKATFPGHAGLCVTDGSDLEPRGLELSSPCVLVGWQRHGLSRVSQVGHAHERPRSQVHLEDFWQFSSPAGKKGYGKS